MLCLFYLSAFIESFFVVNSFYMKRIDFSLCKKVLYYINLVCLASLVHQQRWLITTAQQKFKGEEVATEDLNQQPRLPPPSGEWMNSVREDSSR